MKFYYTVFFLLLILSCSPSEKQNSFIYTIPSGHELRFILDKNISFVVGKQEKTNDYTFIIMIGKGITYSFDISETSVKRIMNEYVSENKKIVVIDDNGDGILECKMIEGMQKKLIPKIEWEAKEY